MVQTKAKKFELNQRVKVIGDFMKGQIGVVYRTLQGTGRKCVVIFPSGIAIEFHEEELDHA